MSRKATAAKTRGTVTSAFGVSRREGHDAGGFYSRFVPPLVSSDDKVARIGPDAANQIYCADSRAMAEVPDASVALVVTSPPYFAGKQYEQDMAAGHVPATYLEYLAMLADVFAECVRKTEPGGRIAVNVANLGRRPYRSLSADVISILQDKLGLLLRGEVIWQKAMGSAGSCAWGSFQRPSNPVLRDLTERVIIASKGRFARAMSASERRAAGLPCVSSVSKDEFMEATTDVWHLASESASRIGHPAPFPVALPERLIHLLTYKNDLVLDPFMGSGTTAVAAKRTGRQFVGYETDPSYVNLCLKRLAEEVPSPAIGGAHFESGASAKESSEKLLSESGFVELEKDVMVGSGIRVSLRARDGGGRTWLFDIAGCYSASGAAGLKKSDILWRALGQAAVLHETCPEIPFVLLTTCRPAEGSAAGSAVTALCGDGKPIKAVIDLSSEADRRRLSRLAETV